MTPPPPSFSRVHGVCWKRPAGKRARGLAFKGLKRGNNPVSQGFKPAAGRFLLFFTVGHCG